VLTDLQRALARALTSDAPVDALKKEAAGLGPEDRALLEGLDPDRFLLTSLIVRKLRFERICRGDTKAEEWFMRDPAGFTEVFRAYNREVPSTEFFPRPEAVAFRKWCRAQGFTNFDPPPASKEA
jgi:hypothetical protein